jgi:low affinity Fe/Cu permease
VYRGCPGKPARDVATATILDGDLEEQAMRDGFRRISAGITAVVGSPIALIVAIAVILLWAVSGPLFRFSDTWQLAINTGTTVVTFLMVFVIQASQNREARATQLKLDEIIRSLADASNEFIGMEEAPEETVELHAEHFKEIVKAAQAKDPEVMDGKPVRPRRRPPTTQPSR